MPRLALLAALCPLVAAAQPVGAAPEGGGLSPGAAVVASVATPAALVGLGLLIGADSGVASALVVAGTGVGPSAGNLLQGAWGDAAIGTGLRVLGAGAFVGGLAVEFQGDGTLRARLPSGLLLLTGVSLAAYGVGHDVHTAAQNARTHRVTVRPTGSGLAVRVGL